MTALEALRSIARGDRPTGELLPPCRLEAFGSEFYGEEAIVQSFRREPFIFSEHATVVEGGGHLAMFEGDTALIADVFGNSVARFWRLDASEPVEAEPAIGVPFDADLFQSRGDLAMRADDHAELSAQALPHVEETGRSLSRDWKLEDGPAPYRSRAFLVRAFTQADSSVALFAVHRLGADAVRTAGFSYAAALFRTDGEKRVTRHIVRDKAGEAAVLSRPWTPRVDDVEKARAWRM